MSGSPRRAAAAPKCRAGQVVAVIPFTIDISAVVSSCSDSNDAVACCPSGHVDRDRAVAPGVRERDDRKDDQRREERQQGCQKVDPLVAAIRDEVLFQDQLDPVGDKMNHPTQPNWPDIGPVWAKPVLDDFPLIWATTLRLSVGTVVLALIALGSPRRKVYWAAMRPSAIWKISLPASVLGTYFAMVFWVGGFKYTDASIAGILNQTSIIFAIILAAVILKETILRCSKGDCSSLH